MWTVDSTCGGFDPLGFDPLGFDPLCRLHIDGFPAPMGG